jgi:pyruvate/2-oxoglutarate/acetoin dehydrogenase E1 component
MVPLARPVAKRDLAVGDTLDQIGEYTYRAWVMTVPEARAAGALPCGLIAGAKVTQSIAKGSDVGRMFADYFGKETCYCHGRGGSMHIADVMTGNLGANGIVGGGLPIAVRAALSAKRLGKSDVTLCFFGDGADNEGAFHESLNMAAVWKLPVIFVCENNGYGMSTSTARSTAVPRIAERTSAYAMPGVTVDGNDLSAIARVGEGPSLVENPTYRWRGHSKSDRNRYRSTEEIEAWIARAPIGRFPAELIAHGILDEAGALAIEAAEAVAQGIDFAKASPAPTAADVTRYVYAEAREGTPCLIREAMGLALKADPTVILMGEDIGIYGGAFQVTLDLIDRFGPERVLDTPISELGGAVGAALTGLKPIYEFQFSDFAMLAMAQIDNQAAKLRYMRGGEASVPVVFRLPSGSGTGAAAQHSQSIEAWFGHVPGLKGPQPATPEDAKGMLLAALADPVPVMIFEHKLLFKMKGPVPEGHYTTPIGKALVRRPGSDLTNVAGSIMLHRALEAAEALAREGISAEIIDLRSIRPIDHTTILASVKKTGRLMVVYEGVKAFGVGAEISAMLAESEAFDFLDAPVPYNPISNAPPCRRSRLSPPPGVWPRPRSDMAVDIILPKVDMGMSHGTLATWHVAEGERVQKGAALFDIETDKAAMEVESPASSILRGIVAQPDDKIPVGAIVALIVAEGEDWAPPSQSAPNASNPPQPTPAAPLPSTYPPSMDPRPRVPPAARAEARRLGHALEGLPGSGPQGRVQRSDIRPPAAGPPNTARSTSASAPDPACPLSFSMASPPIAKAGRPWKRRCPAMAARPAAGWRASPPSPA